MEFLRGVLKKRATIFVLSDFRDTNYQDSLKLLEKKHEVIAGLVQDEAEFLFPDVGLIELQDAESGQTVLVDTSNPVFREQMKVDFKKDYEKLNRELRKSGVDSFRFETDGQYHKSLLAFFKSKRVGR